MMQKGPDSGAFTGKDQHGRHVPKHKMPRKDCHGAKCHITSFPAVESHYCRKDSARKYLEPALSVKFIWRDRYPQWCLEKKYNVFSLYVYCNVFNMESNLGFHKLKKDQYRKSGWKGTAGWIGTPIKKVLQISIFPNLQIIWKVYEQNCSYDFLKN